MKNVNSYFPAGPENVGKAELSRQLGVYKPGSSNQRVTRSPQDSTGTTPVHSRCSAGSNPIAHCSCAIFLLQGPVRHSQPLLSKLKGLRNGKMCTWSSNSNPLQRLPTNIEYSVVTLLLLSSGHLDKARLTLIDGLY